MIADIGLSIDRNGERVLTLRGGWSEECGQAIASNTWDVLALFGVDWPDYTPLLPYLEKLQKLRVPMGPESSKGLGQLNELRVVQMTDRLVPAVDFRDLRHLESLEALWDSRNPQYFANPNISELIIHGVGGNDLRWLPLNSNLKSLRLKGGGLASLDGIERAAQLQTLHAHGVKQCRNVESVMSLAGLRQIDLQTPKATMSDLSWLPRAAGIEFVSIEARILRVDWEKISECPRLQRLAIVSDGAPPENELAFRSAIESSGRRLQRFEHVGGKSPGFLLEIA